MDADRTRDTTAPGDASGAANLSRQPAAVPSTLAWSPAAAGGSTVPIGEDCWFLSGPTASGKTALAIPLARALNAEIVSVDSMAVYRGLDVGTAKPSVEQRAAVPHHALDLVTPAEAFSVAHWLEAAARAVADCRARGRGILFVGGTPLYLRALRDGLAPLPASDQAVRRRLTAEAAAGESGLLHRRLAQVDPASAARIHPHDQKRLIRALEVAETTGRPLSAAFAPAPHPLFESRLLVVDLPRATLYRRIDRRVEGMFAAGLVEETRAALARPGGIGPTARQAAGYAEAIELLAGRIDAGEAIRRTQQRTRQLAKRQLTWLRSFAAATWITA
ncbi:MAG: tRNA (adenosine(37)-N6)-dimethylallyltransferase MiaA [Planctomycetota bacterium]